MILRGEPDVSRSLAPFRERLAETVAWCAPRADAANPRTCLRDPGLAPRPLEPDYFAAVSTVAGRRQSAVSRRLLPHRGGDGRLLVYLPDADLADGAAEVESQGFFDVWNCPPWDTWVGLFRDDRPPDVWRAHCLVAWVPSPLVELAAAGIEVNPEGCIGWLDDTPCELRRLLDPAHATAPAPASGLLGRLFRRG